MSCPARAALPRSTASMTSDLIVSIPQTGTRFLRERLGVRDFVHTIESWEQLVGKTEGRNIVSPLRSPAACWASSTRRWTTSRPFDTELWLHSWYMMHALSLVRDIDFIVIEKRDDPRISDWSKVGDRDEGKNRSIPDIGLRHIYELPFVKARYDIRGPL